MKRFITLFATGGGAGLIPIAPGTFGTVVGVILYLLIKGLSPYAYVAFAVAFIVFAIWVSGKAQDIFDEVDPPQVVIDEIAGFIVTMAFHRPAIAAVVTGFILFRVFDIVKPPPIKWIERRFSDGRGIVLDDVAAGIYANIALIFFEILLPTFGVRW